MIQGLADWLRMVSSCSCLPCIGFMQALARVETSPPADPDRPKLVSDLALTGWELQTLQGIADGCSNKEIGVRAEMAESTIKNRVTKLLRKLQVLDRTQAAILGLDLGLVTRRVSGPVLEPLLIPPRRRQDTVFARLSEGDLALGPNARLGINRDVHRPIAQRLARP